MNWWICLLPLKRGNRFTRVQPQDSFIRRFAHHVARHLHRALLEVAHVSVPKMQWHLKFAGLATVFWFQGQYLATGNKREPNPFWNFWAQASFSCLRFIAGESMKKNGWTKNAIYANVYNATSVNCSHRFINDYVWFKTPYLKMFNYATHTKAWTGSFHVNHASCLMLAAMWKIHWCSLLHTRVCLWFVRGLWALGLCGLWGLWFCGSKLNNMFSFDLTHAVRASNFLKAFVSLYGFWSFWGFCMAMVPWHPGLFSNTIWV